MRKCIAIVLTWLFLLSMSGCGSHLSSGQSTPSASSTTDSLSDYLIEEEGGLYLILPVSKYKVWVANSHTQYLDDIDLDTLKAAEEKLNDKIAQYTTTSVCYYLGDSEGYLVLCAEAIVDITPPSVDPTDPTVTNPTFEQSGCGIDHEHMFFKERIT